MTCRTLIVACTLGFALSLSPSSLAQSDSAPPAGKNKKKTDSPQEPAVAPSGESSGRNKKKTDTPQEPASEGTQVADPGLLAGPSVEQEAEAGRDNSMLGQNNNGARRRGPGDQGLPFRQWMETLRGLGLSADQQQQVAAIATEFQTAQRDFQQAHGEEMRLMQQQVRTARESGKEPDPKVREQFQKLEAEMPQQIDYQQRIWEVLSADQQATARTRLADAEKRMQQQRRANGGAGAGGAGTSGGNGAAPNRPGNRPSSDSPRQPGGESAGDGMLSPSGNGQRNDPRSTTTGSNDQMTGGAQAETPAQSVPASPLRERLREGRRGEAGGISLEGLDDAARRRVEFLMQHQSAARAGNAPMPEEKTFRFKEDGQS